MAGAAVLMPALAQAGITSGNSYRLLSMCNSNMALSVSGNSTANSAPIVLATKNAQSAAQIFKIYYMAGKSAYKITSQLSGKSFDVRDMSTANDSIIQQYSYWGGKNQLFKLSNLSTDAYKIQNLLSQRFIDLQRAKTAVGTSVIQYDSVQYCNQQFKFELVSAVTPPPPPPPVPTPSATPTPTPVPSGNFVLGEVPFAATSSWNTPISASAKYTSLNWPAATGYNYMVNWNRYSPAVYTGKSTDPLVQVSFPANWGWPASTIGIRLPVGVTGAAGTDGEILMIDGNTVHNCWVFKRTSDTTATCAAYGRADLVKSSGWGQKSPFLSAGIVATGSSQMAGLLVQAETDKGEINHALQIALDGALQRPGSTGEAISGDGGSVNGISQEGERLGIPPGTAMPVGLSPLGQKVFRSMQKYGVFNIDVAGGATILRAQSNAYDGTTIGALVRDLNKIIPLLQKVN